MITNVLNYCVLLFIFGAGYLVVGMQNKLFQFLLDLQVSKIKLWCIANEDCLIGSLRVTLQYTSALYRRHDIKETHTL